MIFIYFILINFIYSIGLVGKLLETTEIIDNYTLKIKLKNQIKIKKINFVFIDLAIQNDKNKMKLFKKLRINAEDYLQKPTIEQFQKLKNKTQDNKKDNTQNDTENNTQDNMKDIIEDSLIMKFNVFNLLDFINKFVKASPQYLLMPNFSFFYLEINSNDNLFISEIIQILPNNTLKKVNKIIIKKISSIDNIYSEFYESEKNKTKNYLLILILIASGILLPIGILILILIKK